MKRSGVSGLRYFAQWIPITSVVLILLMMPGRSMSQCGASGTTRVVVNFDWQYFDTIPTGTNGFRFMMGKSAMELKWSGASNTFLGTTGAHSGSASSFGDGDDLKFFVSSGADTMTFQDEMDSLRFSIYDLDIRTRITVTAFKADNSAQNIVLSKANPSGPITLGGTGTVPYGEVTTTTNITNTSNDGTLNVRIPGLVKKVVLTISKTSGSAIDSLYLSDVTGYLCNSIAAWATNYQSVSAPETGQPTLTLATYNNNIYVIDVTNKTSSILYSDPSFTSINSLAYDPYNQVVFYTNNARNSSNKSVYKYDVRTGVRSVLIADVRDLGILLPASIGSYLGSAGAAFYDGSLFLATDANNTIGDAASIYRIDIDPATQTATRASRFWSKVALPIISSRYFDWSDFVIKNGMTYCFNQSIPSPAKFGAFHVSLNTQDSTAGYTTAVRSQAAMDHNENIYHLGAYGSLELYNEAGGFTSMGSYTRVNAADSLVTDGGDSFKYPYDFAHFATYGNAYHLYNTAKNLVIGGNTQYSSTYDRDKLVEDNDGVSIFPELNTGMSSYAVDVSVTNTTGSNAVLYGYIDFNGDGDFSDPGEQSYETSVPNGATSVTVNWGGFSSIASGSTSVRFRLAPTAAESGFSTGYASNGEVEDHTVFITMAVLPVELLEFTGFLQANGSVRLEWSTASESGNAFFRIERSADANTWDSTGSVPGNGWTNQITDYTYTDLQPLEGDSYYRLVQTDHDGTQHPSLAILIRISSQTGKTIGAPAAASISAYPNPSTGIFYIRSTVQYDEMPRSNLEIYDLFGRQTGVFPLSGSEYRLDLSDLPAGQYIARLEGATISLIKK